MSIKDCLDSAVAQGVVDEKTANKMYEDFQEFYAQKRLNMGDTEALGSAKEAWVKKYDAEKIESQRRAALTRGAIQRVNDHLSNYTNPWGKHDIYEASMRLLENYGYSETSSVVGKTKTLIGLAHSEISNALLAHRRKFFSISGKREDQDGIENIVKELFSHDSGDAVAKEGAKSVAEVFETLRQRYNVAGGAIGKLESYGLPQKHDAVKLLALKGDIAEKRAQWKEFIKPLLNKERMVDPLTNEPLTAARFEQVLDYSFDSITTGGMNKVTPSLQDLQKGSLATQRAEHRFLHFKDYEGWKAYSDKFGSGDAWADISSHINSMAGDIAAMEVLGPNPDAMINYLKSSVQSQWALAMKGQASKFNLDPSEINVDAHSHFFSKTAKLESLWQSIRGREMANANLAQGFATARNFITSAKLGGAAVLAGTTDPFVDASARKISGLPVTKAFGVIFQTFNKGLKEDAVRAGIILDDAVNMLHEGGQQSLKLMGSQWSKIAADRTVQWSFLEPMTQARRHVFAMDFMAVAADHKKLEWGALKTQNPYYARTLEGYGFKQGHWDALRSAEVFSTDRASSGILRPVDVRKSSNIYAVEASEKFLEAILQQTERAVPTGTHRSRSLLTGSTARGTVLGEMVESGLQFKSYGLSLTMLQLEAIQNEFARGGVNGAVYAGSLLLSLTLGGALAMQLKNVINGKDMQDITDHKFLIAAMKTGGGLGILGDYLFDDWSRFGHSLPVTLMGPTAGVANDLLKLTLGNTMKAADGKKTYFKRDSVDFLSKNTPVASTLFYSKLAMQRMVFDQMQHLADPDSHRRFADRARKMRKETGQEFWWQPGDAFPTQAPNYSPK
jgi:hypothetical protein